MTTNFMSYDFGSLFFRLPYVVRMSNKSNSFESDLLYFQKGPVPYKADYIWIYRVSMQT